MNTSKPTVFSGAAGTAQSNVIGDLPIFGKAILHDASSVNCISATVTEKQYKVNFYQLDRYEVYIGPGLVIKFNFVPKRGLYCCDNLFNIVTKFQNEIKQREMIMLTNSLGLNKRQIQQAELAREMIKLLGFCNMNDLKRMLNQGAIVNCPITSKDVDNAQILYGRNEAVIKGAMIKRSGGAEMIPEMAKVNPTQVSIYSDVMHIDKIPLLVSVCKPINLLLLSDLSGVITSFSLKGILADQVNLLRKHGFGVKVINLDAASQMLSLTGGIGNVPVQIAAAGSHIGIAERAIRLIKERLRIIINDLQYNLPRRFLVWCANYVVGKINSVPTVNGTGSSARESLTGIKLDYKRDLKLSFGDYVQVYNNTCTSNSIRDQRSLSCIALGPMDNNRGSWKFFYIHTGKTIT